MKQPIIVFAFANDSAGSLSNLERERNEILAIFRPLVDEGKVKLIELYVSQITDIFDVFTRHRDQIVLFHYAGHANSQEIFLPGGAINATGLAKLQAEQRNLAFIFLNACATQKQVTELLRLSIPAVIATSEPVHDQKAADFAIQFYRSLVTMASVETSFNEAVSLLESQSKIPIGKSRVTRFKTFHEKSENKMPWGLYIRDEAKLLWNFKKVIPQNYNLSNIRRFLIQALDDAGFDSFCMLHFPKVYDQLADGMNRDRKIILLINHCRKFERFPDLLSAMQEANDKQYENFKPYD